MFILVSRLFVTLLTYVNYNIYLMLKVKMTGSGGFRSAEDANSFCAFRKHGHCTLMVLRLALAGKPFCPPFVSLYGGLS